MPKPKDIPDRKPQANQQNAQKPIDPRTPPESEPRPAESGRDRDDPSVQGPTRATIQLRSIQPARKSRQENPDSDEKNLILSKTARISLIRRFRLKRNAPDDGKQYEITKQTHRACSVLDQTNGTAENGTGSFVTGRAALESLAGCPDRQDKRPAGTE